MQKSVTTDHSFESFDHDEKSHLLERRPTLGLERKDTNSDPRPGSGSLIRLNACRLKLD